jgi:phosphoribosyl 1,2-cyclic phosphodiesterase
MSEVPEDFTQRIALAIERMKMDGIELWRPSVSEGIEQYFNVVISGSSYGCNNQQCNHVSHDPSSPIIKLIPREGKLVFLGEVEYGEVRLYYYALLMSSDAKYFEVKEEQFYHDKIYEVDESDVPDFLLAKLGEQNE